VNDDPFGWPDYVEDDLGSFPTPDSIDWDVGEVDR
jgi:hypothetical protein